MKRLSPDTVLIIGSGISLGTFGAALALLGNPANSGICVSCFLENLSGSPNEIWGTIFSSTHPRIVRLGEIYMDAQPEGYMLIIQNHDSPGVIGHIGTLLGKHAINIGRFQLGRRDQKALCIVNIDTPADDAVVHELEQLPNILYVKQVHL